MTQKFEIIQIQIKNLESEKSHSNFKESYEENKSENYKSEDFQKKEKKDDLVMSKFGELVKKEISIKTVFEISGKTWLLLLIVFLNSTCYYISYAVLPMVLQEKFGFDVLETGNIMFRIPLIEAISKVVGILLAIKYGKRGYIIMVASTATF